MNGMDRLEEMGNRDETYASCKCHAMTIHYAIIKCVGLTSRLWFMYGG